ncbi:glycoside hydrolase family 9 protein [Daejeonella oryzae]|uniref:glycoside hydrolase family 9 protein n=1 Tax=Daejeonella oryzae TaxID=1122943 RepID=UPI001FDF2B9F|nr:glycoside hydrolase family 9 protein [Daejeonella oryzae]
MKKLLYSLLLLPVLFSFKPSGQNSWIRINQLGYLPSGVKTAIWVSKEITSIKRFEVIDATTNKIIFKGKAGTNFGEYGPFKSSFRLSFSKLKLAGEYYIQAGKIKSPRFKIGSDVYKGSADFALRYMRQQRSGFNPYLKDSCHTNDGFVIYGSKAGLKDSTFIDASGGWHDASDYLQYSSTSANATYHLLAAYRDFPKIFSDEKQANGLDGKNGLADVLDEAKWGLDWLLKMHPKENWMFNQIADDRDHISMRIPKEDNQYGKGFERPLYFITGEPQQRGKFMNNTTGTSSTAAKFASAFALGSKIYSSIDKTFEETLSIKSLTAYKYALKKKGVTQTASVKSPYIYAEDNWVDDMELALASIENSPAKHKLISDIYGNLIDTALNYARSEPVTPWMGADTAKHYQWYPFHNFGHYELAKSGRSEIKNELMASYKTGIEKVWAKAKNNAFYRGIPYIWCSNNLTTSFAIQCYLYRSSTNDRSYEELEQANIDWLFGCNPWGTSMVYGLPANGDTPIDPHSAFTHLKNYPIDGGLVDGPVYGSIFNNLIGIKLNDADEYAQFQSPLVVYHDDYGDYSTNEPTMDGTASLIYLLASKENASREEDAAKK